MVSNTETLTPDSLGHLGHVGLRYGAHSREARGMLGSLFGKCSPLIAVFAAWHCAFPCWGKTVATGNCHGPYSGVPFLHWYLRGWFDQSDIHMTFRTQVLFVSTTKQQHDGCYSFHLAVV